MSARLTILNEIRAVAAEQDKTLAPLTDELPLLNSGSTRCASRSWFHASRILRAAIPSLRR